MNSLYFSLGSNQGDRITILQNALVSISEKIGLIDATSSIYESEPLGFVSNDRFLNLCIKVTTKLNVEEILKIIQSIEKENGRILNSKEGYSSRTLDIDIIFYNDQLINTKDVQIPHPRYTDRLFVLLPLSEITNNFLDPKTFLTIEQLRSNCSDKSKLIKFC